MTAALIAHAQLSPVRGCRPDTRPVSVEGSGGSAGSLVPTGTPPRDYFPTPDTTVPPFRPVHGPLTPTPQLTLLDAVREWVEYWETGDDQWDAA